MSSFKMVIHRLNLKSIIFFSYVRYITLSLHAKD